MCRSTQAHTVQQKRGTCFSLEQIARHNVPDDCWLLIHGKVYDVTQWVPNHPGGPLIYVAAGKDCSALFDSYHPLRVSGLLPKYYVGDLALGPGEAMPVSYQSELQPGQFYHTLKTRVEAYFRDAKLDPRVHPAMFLKSFAILLGLVLAWWGAFFAPVGFYTALCCSVFLGVAKAEIGVSIQHDANHGAYSRSPVLGQIMSASLDLAGASSFMWRQQHVVGHHAYTNVEGMDPDIRVSSSDVRRVAPSQPWHPWHTMQHAYLGVLYGLLAVKSIFVDDFASLLAGCIGPVRLLRQTPSEVALFWAGKAAYVAYMHVLPACASPRSMTQLACLWAVSDVVTGWLLAFMFQVAHVVEGIAFPKADPAGSVPLGWAAAQLATTADFSHGSWVWTHFSGGLNYQSVHHLFPGICHCYYPALAPIVMRTAAEFSVPYNVFPTFGAALCAHFRHLKSSGRRVGIPTLSTIG